MLLALMYTVMSAICFCSRCSENSKKENDDELASELYGDMVLKCSIQWKLCIKHKVGIERLIYV